VAEDGDDLGGWQVVHVPGHTAGSVCFFHPARELIIVGDAVNHRSGRLGTPPPLFSINMDQAYASVNKIATLEFETCCFGHGPPLKEQARERVRALADSVST
jgi:glyoxylase-like metal-dependent hydrolase (beta-lactamase superfamily II)